MDFIEKARIRLEHWISHNHQHHEEYESFIKQLEEAGKGGSADHLREMMALNDRMTECLEKALRALE